MPITFDHELARKIYTTILSNLCEPEPTEADLVEHLGYVQTALNDYATQEQVASAEQALRDMPAHHFAGYCSAESSENEPETTVEAYVSTVFDPGEKNFFDLD